MSDLRRPLGIDTINISPLYNEQKSPIILPKSQISNPLKYLDETEEEYIDDLKCLVEAEEMEGPYSEYCQEYKRDIDLWPEIEHHPPLQAVLNRLTSERNRPITLEFLLDIPVRRVNYYKKIYTRLSKISEFGDFNQTHLVSAIEKFQKILELDRETKSLSKPRNQKSNYFQESANVQSVESRSKDISLEKGQNNSSELPNLKNVENSNKDSRVVPKSLSNSIDPTFPNQNLLEKEKISSTGSEKILPEPKNADDVVSSPDPLGESCQNMKKWTLKEFELQLDTSMKIKVELLPPHLPFKRELILHNEFVVMFPDNKQRTNDQKQAHIFLLTDLLLICQKKDLDEKQIKSEKEFWLMYTPLSGRHISICDDNKKGLVSLKILKRESLLLFSENKVINEKWLMEISKMITFAASLAGTRTQVNADNSQMLRKISSNPQLLSGDVVRKSPSMGSLHNGSANLYNESGDGLKKFLRVENFSPTSMGTGEWSKKLNKSSSLSSLRGNGSFTGNRGSNLSSKERHNDFHDELNLNSTPELIDDNHVNYKKTRTLLGFQFCEVSYCVKNGHYKSVLEDGDEFTVELRSTDTRRICLVAFSEKDKRIILQKFVNSENSLIKKDSPFAVSISIKKEVDKSVEIFRVSLSTPGETERFLEKFDDLVQRNVIIPTKPQASRSLPPQLPQSHIRSMSPQLSPQSSPSPSVQSSPHQSSIMSQPPLLNLPQIVSRSSSLQQIQQHQPRSTLVLESPCRLFLKNDHGIWSNLGWGNMKLFTETNPYRKRIVITSADKNSTKLVDSIVREAGVEKVGKASIAITLQNIIGYSGNSPVVYMIQMKDKDVVNKAMDIMKERQRK
ncbi:15784_t:CDS:2 [Acaulospora colombiana]|uniref:15784_t:CDS:1 n=1 Tax=Acaulospora colombiana TaxID=27376 RepID=A0ACA9L6Z6_9GLOM|nr:15784_t:CDS:2 [Acaulospora colombiana]